MTNAILGGMTIPMAPEALISAVDIPTLYPASTIAGTRMAPSAATVAGPDPDIAAKKQETRTTTATNPLLV